MILFTNGCSWTYGGSLGLDTDEQTEERLQSVWPHHLGNALGADKVINLAAGCGSNQRAFRTTVDWILQQTPDVLKNTTAIIQFTEPSRYEYLLPQTKDDRSSWVKCKIGIVTYDGQHPGIDDWHRETNERRLSTTSELEELYSTLAYCEALHNLFTKHGVKYYFWDAGFLMPVIGDFEDIFHRNMKYYFLTNFNWLPVDINDYDTISNEDRHPSLQGHKEIALRISKELLKDNPGSHTR